MWLVWRPGSPDPSRPSPAIHHDDPAKDRDRSGWLCVPIPVALQHRTLPIAELVVIAEYGPPSAERRS